LLKNNADNILMLIGSAIKIDRAELSSDMAMGQPGWDSFGHLQIMLILEEYCSLEINEKNMTLFQDMHEIKKYVSASCKG
jgi:acyl carrier protein